MSPIISRRQFLGSTAAATAVAAVPHAHAAGGDVLRIGLIGCGGRGTGAASQALRADPAVVLVAMGDAFEDRLQQSLDVLRKDESIASKIDVPPGRRFVGFDAYQQVLASGVDVVLLCTPPHFRPIHLEAAVEAGKHVFAEKPVAVDAPGVRSVLAACERAEAKGLSVVSGLAMRYDNGLREAMRRIHDGAVGDVLVLQATDFRGPIWVRPRESGWSDMTWQMRNWYYFTWLSGDFNVEQHVHLLDSSSWAMGDRYPIRAVGTGGRQQRTAPEYGHIYDHFAIAYEYEGGAKLFATCRQQAGCANDISLQVLGARGRAALNSSRRGGGPRIEAGESWRYAGPPTDPFQAEHDALFASIRRGEPINNGEYMAICVYIMRYIILIIFSMMISIETGIARDAQAQTWPGYAGSVCTTTWKLFGVLGGRYLEFDFRSLQAAELTRNQLHYAIQQGWDSGSAFYIYPVTQCGNSGRVRYPYGVASTSPRVSR
jgi:predicted dehydrogenase